MGQLSFEREINIRLQGKHHLQPVFSGGNYDMLRRIRECDPALFIAWNSKRKQFEVHSLNNQGSTHAFDVPDNRLDARLETLIRKGDIRVRGMKIFDEMEEHNARLEADRYKSRRNALEGVADEMYPYFKRLGWEGV